MLKPKTVRGIALALTVGLGLVPAAAGAWRGGAHRFVTPASPGVTGPRPAARPFVGQPVVTPHVVPHRPPHHSFVRPFGVVESLAIVVSPPVVTSFVPPPTYAPPSTIVTVAPTPLPRVIEYPAGHYELRGDGVTGPYVWVWVPNPPSAPPPAPAPAPEPAPTPGPVASEPQPTQPSRFYRWLDERGTPHWTDRLDAVPEAYRAQAKVVSSI